MLIRDLGKKPAIIACSLLSRVAIAPHFIVPRNFFESPTFNDHSLPLKECNESPDHALAVEAGGVYHNIGSAMCDQLSDGLERDTFGTMVSVVLSATKHSNDV